MPQIPVGRFGNAVAGAGQVATPQAIDTGAGMRAVTGAAQAIASDVVKREQQTLEINNRAHAMTALNTGKADLASLAFEISDGVKSGAIPKDQAESVWSTRSQEVVGRIPELAPDLAPIVRAELSGNATTLALNVRESVVNRARSETSAAMLANVEALGRQYVADPQGADANFETMLEQWAPGSDFTPEQLTALRTRYQESTRYTAALAVFHDAGDDVGKLKKALERISDPANFAEMDPTMRENLAARVEGRIDTLHQRALAAQDRREAAADRAYSRAMTLTMGGWALDEKGIEDLASATRGTTVAGAAAELVSQNRTIQRVLAGPLEEQLATVQAMRAALAQGGTHDPSQVVALQRLEAAVAANVKQVQENPLLALAQRVGGEVAPLDVGTLLAGGGTGESRDAMQARLVQLRTAQKRFGPAAGNSPLLPQEVAQLQAALSQAKTTDEIARVYSALRVSLVQSPADTQYYRAALKQLARANGQTVVNPVVLQAGDLAASNPAAGALVLRGTRADPKLFTPNARDFQTAFTDYVGDAFVGREDALAVSMAVARAHYMGGLAETGQPADTAEGALDEAKVEASIRQAVGVPVDHNGHVVMAPPGMDESTFSDRMDAAWREAVAQGRISQDDADALDDVTLRNGTDGFSYAAINGRHYVRDRKTGRALVLNIDPTRTIKAPPPTAPPWAGLPMGVPE